MKLVVKLHAGVAAAAICMAAFPATAQTQPQTEPDAAASAVEDVVVTGSRIRRSGADTPTPTTIINSEAIRQSGVTEIADLVNQIPSLFVTQSNQTSNQQGNAGLNALDLRGLGTERTLVLVNGRRRVPAMPGSSAVDVSAVPAGLVERVEVITGGASALYGADAVAGVANFILKKDFDGFEFSGMYSGSFRGDLTGYDADILYGKNFHDGRGNVTGFASYSNHTDPAYGQDRPWTAAGTPLYWRNADGTYRLTDGNRSIYDLSTAVVELGGKGNLFTFNADGSMRRPVMGPSGILNTVTANTDLSSYQTDGGEFLSRYDDWLLSVPTERYTLATSANYDLSDTLRVFGDLTYAHTDAKAGYQARAAYGYDLLYAGNPFITPEMEAANGGPISSLAFTRRYWELGRQETHYDRGMVQATVGLEGSLPSIGGKVWDWAAYYSYGQTRQKLRSVNATADSRYMLALDAISDGAGGAMCRSTYFDPTNGCVPLNPFKTLTSDVIDYLQYDTSEAVQTLKQQVFSAYATGDLFNLPAGAVKGVIGGEYRKESNDIGAAPEYDEASDKFDPTLGVTETSLVGEYDVAEVFGELRIPILADMWGAEELTFEGAVRYSDYSTAGETTAYKLALDWAPIRDIRFRTTYGQAVRAPNISELFTSTRVGGAWLKDPCNYYDVDNRISRSQYTKANCQTLAPQNVNTYWQWLDVLNTGNEKLKVETANTFTAGVVLRPRFIPNLSLTVDYFDIDLEDAIDSFGAQLIMEKCIDAASLDNMFCDYVNRDPATNNLVSVEVTQLNLAQFITRGIDFEMNYRFNLIDVGMGEEAGSISINAVYTKLLERTFVLDPSDPNTISETVGLFGAPEWKGAVRTSWQSGPWSASWTLRHFSPMRPGSHVTSDVYDVAETDHVFYSDLYAGYQVNDRVTLQAGLRNAFDKAPPRLPGAEAGGANFEFGYQAGTYDVLGRTFFIGIRLTH